ncbi:hypothetical protein FCV25MIE_16264 [Fagus crenata]
MLADPVDSVILDKPVDFEEGEIAEDSGSEECDVAGECSMEAAAPLPPSSDPGNSSFDCSMAFPDREEVRSISVEAMKPDLIRTLPTSMVRVDLAVEDLGLDPGEASNQQELVIFSDTAQVSPLRMLEVPECGEEPLSPLMCASSYY